MSLPRLGQYQLALQHPVTAFADPELRSASVEMTPMGLPRVISGGFALTYHLKNGRQEWAVRCFHREASELGRRYQAIGAMIAAAGPGPFVSAAYLDRGVQVEGAWYPVTKMPWLQAVPINRYIESNLDRRTLSRLAPRFRALIDRLEALGVAHGDLQHGNILVNAFGNLRLVDYDGMFVPALDGMAANESGHVNYQSPRRSGQFDAGLDRFSAAVIFTALSALAADPLLWHRYANGENLLFKRADFDDPDGSAIFKELRAMPALTKLGDRLATLCQSDYDALPRLREFADGRMRSTPDLAPTAPAPLTHNQFDVIDAADTERLLHHEGDVVTVVGQIATARQRWSRQRRPYVAVHVGPDKTNGLTLELWSQTLNFFMPSGQVITAFNGQWVRAIGLVAITHRRDAARTPRPVITINLASDIQLITQMEAADFLDARTGVPWYRLNRRPRLVQQPPVSVQAATTLNRLYDRPPPADRVPDAPDPAPVKRRARKTRVKPQGSTPATNPSGGADWWRGILGRSAHPGRGGSTAALAAFGKQVLSQITKLILALSALATLTTVVLLRLLWQ